MKNDAPVTWSDLEVLRKEVIDIATAAPKLVDGDPSNDGAAAREIAQSASVILFMLAGATAAVVHVLVELKVI